MNHEALNRLMDRWNSDAAFRAAMRANPLAALEQSGVQLSPADKEAIAAFDWSLPDSELAARASHAM